MNHPLPTSQTWVAQELATARFGDARLTKRLIRIVTDKLAKPTASIPHASDDWAATKAAYRLAISCAAGGRRERAGCRHEAGGGNVRTVDPPSAWSPELRQTCGGCGLSV